MKKQTRNKQETNKALAGVCPVCREAAIEQPARGRRKLTCGDPCALAWRLRRQTLARGQARSLEALEAALAASGDFLWAARVSRLLAFVRSLSPARLVALEYRQPPGEYPGGGPSPTDSLELPERPQD
jgi:hypothetical protein